VGIFGGVCVLESRKGDLTLVCKDHSEIRDQIEAHQLSILAKPNANLARTFGLERKSHGGARCHCRPGPTAEGRRLRSGNMGRGGH